MILSLKNPTQERKMKKKLIRNVALALTGTLFFAGSAMALPILPDGYDWTENNFWTSTDLTTAVDGTSTFTLSLEEAAYESTFGLYTVDDYANPTTVVSTFQVFDRTDEPSVYPLTKSTIHFRKTGGTTEISYDASTWQEFYYVLVFYFGVDAGNNGSIDYTFYTASNLNTSDPGGEHILLAYNAVDKDLYIYLEDLLSGNADWDYQDMVVFGDDLQPVPEPATMLLFGTGLSGLAALCRRKRNA
jgi:hypothetical protein